MKEKLKSITLTQVCKNFLLNENSGIFKSELGLMVCFNKKDNCLTLIDSFNHKAFPVCKVWQTEDKGVKQFHFATFTSPMTCSVGAFNLFKLIKRTLFKLHLSLETSKSFENRTLLI